jgi:hypothetical protein
MARPLARATVESRFEAEEPVGAAVYPPGPRRTRTRANWTFSFGPDTSVSSLAVTSGRYRVRRPIIFRSAGRTNTSNDTKAETGLPGRPK